MNIARSRFVEGVLRPSGVLSPSVLGAFSAVPRESFVPQGQADASLAFLDTHQAVFPHEPASALSALPPLSLSLLLQAAELSREQVVLVLGTGSGYSVAVTSQMVGAVIGVETNAEIVETARNKLSAVSADNSEMHCSPLPSGWPSAAPYHCIVIEGIAEHIPTEIFDQLRSNGRLVTVQMIRGVSRIVVYFFSGVQWVPSEGRQVVAGHLPMFAAHDSFS